MQLYDYIPIHGLWPIAWLDGDRLRRNMIKKIGAEKTWRRGMWIDLSKWEKKTKVKIFVSHVNDYQRVTLAEENFNNQVDRISYPVAINQPVFPSHPCH